MSLTRKQADKFNELRSLGYESCNLPPEDLRVDPKNLLCRKNYGHNTQYQVVSRSGIVVDRKTVWHEEVV